MVNEDQAPESDDAGQDAGGCDAPADDAAADGGACDAGGAHEPGRESAGAGPADCGAAGAAVRPECRCQLPAPSVSQTDRCCRCGGHRLALLLMFR